jgi:hypothetical protein
MPREIFPSDTFEKQTNGSIFYKEGRLEDFPTAGKGIFESWRYNFDAGKQLFRAENTGRVYEKRIVKDIHGNPMWTGWMEIPDAEVKGVQAIAINDRPLQLPNSDGAIKLNITPAVINTYSKEEILNIVDEKVSTSANKAYIYVKWVTDPITGKWADTPKRVLELTYPDGGLEGYFYLVEPQPGVSGTVTVATYYIWDEVAAQRPGGGGGYFDWIQIDVPDLKSFVSYPVFYDHTHDQYLHLSGQFERDNWNAASGLLDVVSGSLDSHISDIANEDAVHITPEERAKWNNAFEGIAEFPKDEKRYVASQSDYVLAFEQVQTNPNETKSIFSTSSTSLKNGHDLVGSLTAAFNDLIADDDLIIKVQLDVGSVTTLGATAWLETDTGIKSPMFTTGNPPMWSFNYTKPFDRITLFITDDTKTVNLQQVNLTVTYKRKTYANIGDGNSNIEKRLQLNLVGPENKEILYNGKSLFDSISGGALAQTAKWGKIFGDINAQNDLNIKLSNLLDTKINHADMNSHLRWDVYRDGVIAGLIQQPGNEFSEEDIIIGDLAHLEKDTVIIDSVQQKLLALKETGKIPYAAKLSIDFVSCYQNSDGNALPIWFETDNPLMNPSPTTASAPFTWNWPGNTFELYDQIVLRGNAVEHLDKVKFKIYCIKYGDAVAEAKGYQFTINGTNLYLNSSGNITQNASSGLLSSFFKEVNEKITENKTIAIGKNSNTFISGTLTETVSGKVTKNYPDFELNSQDVQITGTDIISADTTKLDITAISGIIASKDFNIQSEKTTIGVTPKAYDADGDTIKVYGEEIDSRYASRKLFNTYSGTVNVTLAQLKSDISGEIHDRISGITWEAWERTSGFEYFSGALEDKLDALDTSISGRTYNYVSGVLLNYYTKTESDNNYYKKSQVYTKSEVDAKLFNQFGEQWDLIINNNEELKQAIEDDLFTINSRVLIKSGEYNYAGTGNDNNYIDLSGVNFIKGEEPVLIKAPNTSIVNDSETLFETIRFELNNGAAAYEIDSTGSRVKKVTVAGNQQVALDKFHSIYQLILHDDAKVNFTNVVSGRDYIIWVDQEEEIKNFNISNYLHNARELYTEKLENQYPRIRTVFLVTGNNETEENGLVIKEIIPNVKSTQKEGAVNIILGNILGPIHNSNEKVKFVTVWNDYPVQYNIGESVNIRSDFYHHSAWKHAADGIDWIITDPSKGENDPDRILATGIISPVENDPAATFVLPNREYNQDLILDFIPTQRIFEVVLDDQYVTTKNDRFTKCEGFGQYQGYYNEVIIDIICKDNYTDKNGDGWFIYKVSDNLGNNYEADMPWRFYINPNILPAIDKVIITPHYYKTINNIPTISVTNNPGASFSNTLSNYSGIVHKRNAMDEDKKVYFGPRKVEDFVYYENSNTNALKFNFTPGLPSEADLHPALPDPISIIDYDSSKIEVINNNNIKIKNGSVNSFNFTTLTGAGLELKWDATVVKPVTVGHISGIQNYINNVIAGEGPNEDNIVHIAYYKENDPLYADLLTKYAYEMNWEGKPPTHETGNWAVIQGNTIKIDTSVTASQIDVIPLKQGSSILQFQSAFDTSKKFTKTINVKVHPEDVIPNILSSRDDPYSCPTSFKFNLGLNWLDKIGNTIDNPDSALNDIEGLWTIPEEYKDWISINKNMAKAVDVTTSNKAVSTSGKEVRIDFIANTYPMIDEGTDPHKINENKQIKTSFWFVIYRGTYRLDVTTTDPNYLGVQGSVQGLYQAETLINMTITLKPGTKLANNFEDYLRNELGLSYSGAGQMVTTSDGVGRLLFDMPYKNLTIDIKTTTI